MSKHPLQESLDNLPDYLADAARLYGIVEQRNATLAAERRASGNRTGAGSPPVANKSLNRAVVVASVGALEAFCEDLALRALPLVGTVAASTSWFPIEGTGGMVQTPNSRNIAKMLWAHFHYDPRPDWNIVVSTSWAEVGNGTRWRGTTKNYQGNDAASALDTMVKVRHGFAHQDRASAPPSMPGIVELTPTRKLSLQSHHALNSMSIVVQVAVQTTHGLAAHLGQPTGPFRWKQAMGAGGWERLLGDTPAATEVQAQWTHHPF
ncbi:MAG: hypothetical protein J0H73_13595 [Salana multivorans]|uniref:hypothetical protein n=1 Tax=Salana multivorans TaxID=120377 RepID=UPI000AB92FA0|nr:hypothetical protein [Salana multivorans]MBN8883334.1 hypothetical protein [Salana multivorans]